MQIFLGQPPENIKRWILENFSSDSPTEPIEPTGKAETVFYFSDGTSEEHLIEGTLDQNWMIAKGYFSDESYLWTKEIVKVEIGTGVTEIGGSTF